MIISNAGWFVLLFHILVLIWAPTIQKSAVFREKYKKHIKPLIPKGVLWGKHLVASLLATGYGAIWGLLLPGRGLVPSVPLSFLVARKL